MKMLTLMLTWLPQTVCSPLFVPYQPHLSPATQNRVLEEPKMHCLPPNPSSSKLPSMEHLSSSISILLNPTWNC